MTLSKTSTRYRSNEPENIFCHHSKCSFATPCQQISPVFFSCPSLSSALPRKNLLLMPRSGEIQIKISRSHNWSCISKKLWYVLYNSKSLSSKVHLSRHWAANISIPAKSNHQVAKLFFTSVIKNKNTNTYPCLFTTYTCCPETTRLSTV